MSTLFHKENVNMANGGIISSKVAIISIIVIHFFGALGLSYPPLRPYFQLATPLNLLITGLILFSFHRHWNVPFYIFATVCFSLGFLVEVIGVKTGVIFGEYSYGPTLGFKIWEVPVLIGLNWLILIYCTGIVASKLVNNVFASSFLGSLMMVALDFFIEPVAVSLDFWKWHGGEIPTHNFLGWFVTAFLLQILFHLSNFKKQNALAKQVLYVQALFFIFLQILDLAIFLNIFV